ncbi:MAG: glycine cleavage system aminomethyltransferase GcvT [Treponemataceae bacterium]|nr:MAG: glycine cleavage system aminomethyltransferase GcvT [Treponemataceae bacterium]
MEKKTPLYSWHESHGGKIVPFAGYLMPVQYQAGIIAEHNAVRTHAGLFDVSHMGEFTLKGKDALKNLQYLLTNDFSNMADGRVRYTLLCNERGGIIDDLVVCKMDGGASYMLVVNAANRAKDFAWMQSRVFGDAVLEDISDTIAQIAIQGPKAEEILSRVTQKDYIPRKYYTLTEKCAAGGIPCVISRTGYTGEAGFELYCASGDAVRLWELLLQADSGLLPCGLGARDTLRLEAAMPLYGHEMDETVNPFEANLSFAVKMDKADFIGKSALIAGIRPKRIRAGLAVTGRGIARGGEDVFAGGSLIGKTTSGTFCPFVKRAIAMALVDTEYSAAGTAVEIGIRGRRVEGSIVPMPFYAVKK